MASEKTAATAAAPKMQYLKHGAKILLFYFGGLSVFLISGFIIFKVLFADTEKAVVPDVVGRLFLGEHNKLRDDFKVEIKPAYLVQYAYGYILAQDVTPGKRVDKNTKLELLVNMSDAIVQVPKLVGFSEELIDGSISSLPVGGRIFSLRKGVITRVPSNQPKREVLAQFPPAGTPVIPDSPVSLLISDGPAGATPTPTKAELKIEKGTPVAIALGAAYHTKTPATIRIVKTEKHAEHALLLADAKISATAIDLEVGEFTETLQSGKSAIALEDLPFTTLSIPEKKWGSKDENITIARREAQANEDGSYYSEFYYIKNSSPLPVFRRRDDTFDVFKGYYENAPKPTEVKKTDTTGTKQIIGEEKKVEAQVAVQSPEKSVRLKAQTL